MTAGLVAAVQPVSGADASTGPALCSASSLRLGGLTTAPAPAALHTEAIFATVGVRNAGPRCVLRVPSHFAVAAATGPFTRVVTTDVSGRRRYPIGHGASSAVVLGASWWIGNGGRPAADQRCADPVADVRRVRISLGAGHLTLRLDTPWQRVCPAPASTSVEFDS